ncbi:hypothetical protein KSP39_PZI010676 [Platanthera zijinensis]|uniref:Uncharacterized protein n=1 Tax=Platanthera zijinensis TaxID=2320716 RepID=A0AAP0BIT7_9ASPA
MKHTSQKINRLNTESKPASQNKSLATHDTSHQNTGNSSMIHAENNLVREDKISVLNNLKDLLNAANLEKAEIASKYEKLAIICQTRRREIHELKQALSAATASPPLTRDSSKHQIFPASLQSTTSIKSPRRECPQKSSEYYKYGLIPGTICPHYKSLMRKRKQKLLKVETHGPGCVNSGARLPHL